MDKKGQKANCLAIAVMLGVAIAISAPIYYYRIMNATDNDFGSHIVFTYSMLAKEPLTPAVLGHPLLQMVLAGMVWISRSHIDPFAAMIILQVACQAVLSLLLYFWIGKLNRKGGEWLRALAATTLTVIVPVLALIFVDNQYYFGYIDLANYHNPTIQMLRPLALVSFYFAYRIFERERNAGWTMAASAVVLILSALTKPSYVLCILPALVFLAIIWRLLKRKLDWQLFIFGFIIPGVAILFVQWLLTYGTPEAAETRILFNPFVEGYFSKYLLWKFLLSILFPLVVTVMFFKKALRDLYVVLGWVGFAAGAGIFYLFSEGGKHMYAGNFRWGTQVMLFLLFAAVLRFLLRLFTEEKSALWKQLVAWGVYGLHLASGVVYYIHCITGNPYT